MTTNPSLLDLPPYPAERYAGLADRLKALLSTRNDVVFVQAEAILALEAVAASLGRWGLTALNIVTSPYGGYFGDWLARAGATVETIAAEPGRPIAVGEVERALGANRKVDLIAVVHAETSSGIVNPLAEIAALARARGALLVVDAVASVGGHALDVDALGIDVCVIGAQKALAGPTALSAASISSRAWMAMRPQPAPSSLSLLDLKTNWLDRGRGVLPGMPSALEFWALEAALDRVETETPATCVARHGHAARATRAALRALGADLWIEAEDEASTLVTAVRTVPGDVDRLVTLARNFGATVSPGFGAVRDRLVRFDHTGRRASRDAVLVNVQGYALAVGKTADTSEIGAILAAVPQV